MDTQRVEVLHVAHRDAVVITVTHYLVLNLLPALEALLHQHLGRESKGLLSDAVQFLLVVAETRTQSAQCISSTDDDGIAQLFGSLAGVFNILTCLALDGLHIDFIEFLHKELAVFGVDDCLYGSTQNLHAVLLQHSALVELHSAVEGSLASEGKQDTLRALLFDYLLHEIRCYRQEVNLVGNSLAGLNRSDIGVDEYTLDALLAQGFECL